MNGPVRHAATWISCLSILVSCFPVADLPLPGARRGDDDCGCPAWCPCRGGEERCCSCARSRGLAISPACACGKKGSGAISLPGSTEGILAEPPATISLPAASGRVILRQAPLPLWRLAAPWREPS